MSTNPLDFSISINNVDINFVPDSLEYSEKVDQHGEWFAKMKFLKPLPEASLNKIKQDALRQFSFLEIKSNNFTAHRMIKSIKIKKNTILLVFIE